jgi:hypothetical protein
VDITPLSDNFSTASCHEGIAKSFCFHWAYDASSHQEGRLRIAVRRSHAERSRRAIAFPQAQGPKSKPLCPT